MTFTTTRVKASCRSQVETARAVREDVGESVAVSKGITDWSSCGLQNSERDVQRVIGRQGTKLNIPVKTLEIKGLQIPWIDPLDWMVWILKKGLWPRLAGVAPGQYDVADTCWKQFWTEYQKLVPNHQVFDFPNFDMSKTAACMIHGDEGRTLKRHGIMITCFQSALGEGFDSKRLLRRNVVGGRLKMNYAGHSFTHRYLMSAMPKVCYENDPDIFHQVMERIAISFKSLFEQGVRDPVSGHVYRIAIIACKGDAPYLVKLGRFYRAYNTTAKRGDERAPPKGVCHRCLAGCNGFPAEDIGRDNPTWLRTEGVKNPWLETPAVVRHLCHDPSDPSSMFQSDIWHVVHLGFGRTWIASMMIIILEVVPAPNLESKWAWLTNDYKSWCTGQRRQKHISGITPYLMSYGDKTGAMGNWHKASLTTNFFRWVPDLLAKLPADVNQYLPQCRIATIAMNELFSVLFQSDVFLVRHECDYVSSRGLFFLRQYQVMANALFRAGKPWGFPLYPKLHAFHKQMIHLKRDGSENGFSINPLLYCCQVDEDSVGRVSRLSRRVNIRKCMVRTFDRWLVAAFTAFNKAGILK